MPLEMNNDGDVKVAPFPLDYWLGGSEGDLMDGMGSGGGCPCG